MNKEEFKASIIRQVRNPDSPFRWLMLNDCFVPIIRHVGKFQTQRTFACSEFNLIFRVETLDDEVGMQVLFEDVEGWDESHFENYVDLTNVEEINRLEYKRESIRVGKAGLTFALEPKKLNINTTDYTVRFVPTPHRQRVAITFTKENQWKVPKAAIQAFLADANDTPSVEHRYIEFEVTNERLSQIRMLIRNVIESDVWCEKLVRCFRPIPRTDKYSQSDVCTIMTRILRQCKD